jgi:hypothetical protein
MAQVGQSSWVPDRSAPNQPGDLAGENRRQHDQGEHRDHAASPFC